MAYIKNSRSLTLIRQLFLLRLLLFRFLRIINADYIAYRIGFYNGTRNRRRLS